MNDAATVCNGIQEATVVGHMAWEGLTEGLDLTGTCRMGRIWTGSKRKGDKFRSPERIQAGKGDFTQVREYVGVKKCGKKGKVR